MLLFDSRTRCCLLRLVLLLLLFGSFSNAYVNNKPTTNSGQVQRARFPILPTITTTAFLSITTRNYNQKQQQEVTTLRLIRRPEETQQQQCTVSSSSSLLSRCSRGYETRITTTTGSISKSLSRLNVQKDDNEEKIEENNGIDSIFKLFGYSKTPPAPKTTTTSSKAINIQQSDNDEQADTTNDSDIVIYDLAIIGGGVVGVSAALAARQETSMMTSSSLSSSFTTEQVIQPSPKIILVDSPKASGKLYNDATKEDLSLGGPTGLFSKALRDTSKRINVATLRGMGLREDSVWNEIINSCIDLASTNAQEILRQLQQNNIVYTMGYVSFCSSSKTTTDSSSLTKLQLINEDDNTISYIYAKKTLICTGSKPFVPKDIPFDSIRIFDSDSINTLQFLPKSIVITGSGIIAVEYAKIFRNLGSDVTVIIRDTSPRNALMKIGLDKDVAATLVADLIRSGIKFVRGAQVSSFIVPPVDVLCLNKEPIKITIKSIGQRSIDLVEAIELKCDAYIAAVGRVPNTQDLQLNNVNINVDEYGGIKVDTNLCTTSPCGTIYAAGDVIGRPFLASIGVAQAKAVIKTIFNPSSNIGLTECQPGDLSCTIDGISQVGESFDPASLSSNPFAFPTGVWSSPEASYYGLSVQQAKERNLDCGEGMALYAECLRGRVFSPNGLLKLVYEKTSGKIVGVHICGDDACELIHYGMELVKSKRTVQELSQAVFSAVTFHEMYKIAAQAALDEKGARQRRAFTGKALAQRNRSYQSTSTSSSSYIN